MGRYVTSRGMAALAIAAVILAAAGGCAGPGRRTEVEPGAPAAWNAGKSSAYAHYAAGTALDLEAQRLEELFAYQKSSLGTRQPSLLRDASKLRNEALAEMDLALKKDPHSAPVIRRKGEILLELRRVDESVKCFAEADKILPAEARWYFRTAGQLEILGRLAEAALLLERAASQGAGMPEELRRVALVELGSLYLRLDRLEDSEKAFKQAIEMGRARGAPAGSPLAATLSAGLEQDPTAIRRTLVLVLRQRGKLDEALEQAQIAVSEAPRDPRTMIALAGAYGALSQNDKAVGAAESFVDGNPDSEMGVLTLMRLLEAAGRIDDAVARGKAFLAGRRGGEKIEEEIISAYRAAGRTADAEKFAFEGLEGNLPDMPVALMLLDIYVSDKRVTDAFGLAERILQAPGAEPADAGEVFARLWGGLSLDDAERFYDEYSKAHPDSLIAPYGFARVLRARGDVERAGQLFVHLAEKGAPYADAYEMAAAYLASKGEAYRAVTCLLSGMEKGVLDRAEAMVTTVVEGASEPGKLAAELEADADNYKQAAIAFDQVEGRLYERAGDNAKAEVYFRRAIESPTPELADYAGLAIALYRQDKNDEAIQLVEDLRKKGQGAPPLLRMLVGMLSRDRKYESARSIARDLISEQPTDVDNRISLANVYIEEGDYPSAERELMVTQDLAEGDPEALLAVRYLLGIVYEEEGKDALAVSMWRANLTVAPKDADSNNALAYHFADRGENLAEAEKLVAKALEVEPGNGAYLDTLGWVYYKKGDVKRAVEVLTKASAGISDPVAYDHLGDALIASGDGKGALGAWQKALANGPKAKDRERIEEKIRANPRAGT